MKVHVYYRIHGRDNTEHLSISRDGLKIYENSKGGPVKESVELDILCNDNCSDKEILKLISRFFEKLNSIYKDKS